MLKNQQQLKNQERHKFIEMTNKILKQLIKEEIRKVLKEEEGEKTNLDAKTSLTPLVKQLDGVDSAKFNMVWNLLKQGKTLNNAANKVLANTFVALMTKADVTLVNKFVQAFKKIN